MPHNQPHNRRLNWYRSQKTRISRYRTKIRSNKVAWSTLTNSASQALTSSSDVAGLSSDDFWLSTWYLQYSITFAKILLETFGNGIGWSMPVSSIMFFTACDSNATASSTSNISSSELFSFTRFSAMTKLFSKLPADNNQTPVYTFYAINARTFPRRILESCGNLEYYLCSDVDLHQKVECQAYLCQPLVIWKWSGSYLKEATPHKLALVIAMLPMLWMSRTESSEYSSLCTKVGNKSTPKQKSLNYDVMLRQKNSTYHNFNKSVNPREFVPNDLWIRNDSKATKRRKTSCDV